MRHYQEDCLNNKLNSLMPRLTFTGPKERAANQCGPYLYVARSARPPNSGRAPSTGSDHKQQIVVTSRTGPVHTDDKTRTNTYKLFFLRRVPFIFKKC